jgi:hypothetical protein
MLHRAHNLHRSAQYACREDLRAWYSSRETVCSTDGVTGAGVEPCTIFGTGEARKW